MTRPLRPRQAAATISEAGWAFLCDAPPPAGTDPAEWWGLQHDKAIFAPGGKTAADLWEEHGAAVLAWWTIAHPGTRPSCWWRYTAPEPRQRLGGIGTPAASRLAHVLRLYLGAPADWITDHDLRVYELIGHPLGVPAIDPADPPIYESEARYLARLALLLPGENRRLTAADFAPEPITDILRDAEER